MILNLKEKYLKYCFLGTVREPLTKYTSDEGAAGMLAEGLEGRVTWHS